MSPSIPFSPPELSVRWARNTVRASSILRRIVGAGADMPAVDRVVDQAREVLDGAPADPLVCQQLTESTWALVESCWDSLVDDDPFRVRYGLFLGYADASAGAAADWTQATR